MVSRTKYLILVVSVLFVIILIHGISDEIAWRDQSKPAGTLIKSIGYIGLSLSSGCISTRNPILEPTCLTDVPGGYCYHESCGMVAPVIVEPQFHLEVIRR